ISARVGGNPVRDTVSRMRSRISCWRSVSLLAMAMIRKADCMDIQHEFWTTYAKKARAARLACPRAWPCGAWRMAKPAGLGRTQAPLACCAGCPVGQLALRHAPHGQARGVQAGSRA